MQYVKKVTMLKKQSRVSGIKSTTCLFCVEPQSVLSNYKPNIANMQLDKLTFECLSFLIHKIQCYLDYLMPTIEDNL